MKKTLRLSLLSLLFASYGFAQDSNNWSKVSDFNVKTVKHVQRNNFPKEYQLFRGNFEVE